MASALPNGAGLIKSGPKNIQTYDHRPNFINIDSGWRFQLWPHFPAPWETSTYSRQRYPASSNAVFRTEYAVRSVEVQNTLLYICTPYVLRAPYSVHSQAIAQGTGHPGVKPFDRRPWNDLEVRRLSRYEKRGDVMPLLMQGTSCGRISR